MLRESYWCRQYTGYEPYHHGDEDEEARVPYVSKGTEGWQKMKPDKLTFSELLAGEKFIVFPAKTSGDGYLGHHDIFIKTGDDLSIRLRDGCFRNHYKTVKVLRVV
jgi:hypothetical protein